MDSLLFSSRHDHCLVFSKNISKFSLKKMQVDISSHYDKTDALGRIFYLKPLRAMGGQGDSREARPNLFFPLSAPDGSEVLPMRTDGKDGAWRWGKEKIGIEASRIDWRRGKNGWNPYFRIYADTSEGRPAETIWTHSDVGSNRTSKIEVKTLFDGEVLFDTPKPEALIKRILEIATNPNDLVLDSFLGSGTTAAVAHKMGRRWIGIEMGAHAETHCIPRLEKVIAGEQGGISSAVGWAGGGGFAHYMLGEPVFMANRHINPQVKFAALAAFVWHRETQQAAKITHTAPLLGVHEGTAYYLLYNGILRDLSVDGGNVLTRSLWDWLQSHHAPSEVVTRCVVYGEICKLAAPLCAKLGIVFKQMPYRLQDA
jgi:adenine-specific DNA-methyltransferase